MHIQYANGAVEDITSDEIVFAPRAKGEYEKTGRPNKFLENFCQAALIRRALLFTEFYHQHENCVPGTTGIRIIGKNEIDEPRAVSCSCGASIEISLVINIDCVQSRAEL